MNTNVKFAFFGTPDVARRTLDILFHSGYIPTVIITSPDTEKGRGLHLTETPVSAWAREHSISCLKPEKITREFIEEFKQYNVDLSLVVAYGKLLPQALIDIPRLKTINIHYSLLPKYRGASPVEEALLNGDTVTGVSIQQMQLKLDSGPLLAQIEVPIEHTEGKEALRNKLIDIGTHELIKILPDIALGKINPIAQDELQATHCSKIKKEDGKIDPLGDGKENYNKYRAFEGWPGIYFFTERHGKKIRVKITKAAYENDQFIIEKVIPEGKKEMLYSDFLRG